MTIIPHKKKILTSSPVQSLNHPPPHSFLPQRNPVICVLEAQIYKPPI